MYGFLGAAILAGAAWLWLRGRGRVARQWAKLFAAAAQAERGGDLVTAERLLREADVFAAAQSGLLWNARLKATKYPMAQVLYRSGQLQRAAELAFDQLQQARAVT